MTIETPPGGERETNHSEKGLRVFLRRRPQPAPSLLPLGLLAAKLAAMKRIVVLNPKGGSGKTTLATNLAGYFASQGLMTTLMDYDPQGSSNRWLRKRTPNQAPIHGIAAYERDPRVTRSFQLRLPEGTQRVIVDTPAAITAQAMPEMTRDADVVLVPVLPSDIDIHACSRCIADLLLVAKIPRNANRIGVIANRVKKHTLVYRGLMRFLETLRIPVVATLRDSQAYLRAAELGMSIHEMKPHLVREDLEQWEALTGWLEGRTTAPRQAPSVDHFSPASQDLRTLSAQLL